MNFLDKADTHREAAQNRVDPHAVLAREAGVPFQPMLGSAPGIDPFAECLSRMEVAQAMDAGGSSCRCPLPLRLSRWPRAGVCVLLL